MLCVKFRQKLLILFGKVVKQWCFDIAKMDDYEILNIETDQNHIHILINYPPQLSLTNIVAKIKQVTTFRLYQEFGGEMRKYFYRKRVFWSSGYFVSSVGTNSETIANYIDSQGVGAPRRPKV